MTSHRDGRESPEQKVPSFPDTLARTDTGAWTSSAAQPGASGPQNPSADASSAPESDASRGVFSASESDASQGALSASENATAANAASRGDASDTGPYPSDTAAADHGVTAAGAGLSGGAESRASAESAFWGEGGDARGSGGYRTRRLRRRRRIRRLVPAALIVAAMLPLAGYGLYTQVDGNIRHVSAADLGPRPAKRTQAENILVVGSDSRQGANAGYGKEEGARTDTMILFHVPANGKDVRGISLPRDSVVPVPACRAPGGATVPARTGMINSAFNEAGLACAWKTVEGATGVRVDHALQIDFTGFKSMVDALGGVEVNVPARIDDTKAGLHLAAGRQKLNGEQALGYARVRYSVGDGSDLGRIRRQQQLMTAMADKARGQLGNPTRLYAFLRAASKSVVTDKGLGLKQMFDLSSSVGDTGRIRFGTVPVAPYPADPNRLQWTQPAAGQLFQSLR
ncbi:LytR family transcriptional regulator [Actinomadura logoneensis]|uniref:LytR family transcriptional regulator n=1 Tax=Actinomadura logoneensis TaxID=2293572 RepID=A0A372JQE0_9ACTN|nr:LCP family protein [Actinomadura logoneensis]RFU42190.1 LytR family transcriptional regulator [Actinomadura logoneensis]